MAGGGHSGGQYQHNRGHPRDQVPANQMAAGPNVTATQKMQMIVHEVKQDRTYQETQKMKSVEQVIIKALKAKC